MLKGLKTLAMGNPMATAAVAVVAGTAIAAVAANQDGTAVIKIQMIQTSLKQMRLENLAG